MNIFDHQPFPFKSDTKFSYRRENKFYVIVYLFSYIDIEDITII